MAFIEKYMGEKIGLAEYESGEPVTGYLVKEGEKRNFFIPGKNPNTAIVFALTKDGNYTASMIEDTDILDIFSGKKEPSEKYKKYLEEHETKIIPVDMAEAWYTSLRLVEEMGLLLNVPYAYLMSLLKDGKKMEK